MITAFVLGLVLAGSMTNMDMVETTVIDAMQPVAEQVSEQGIESVTLSIQGEHEGGWLLEQIAASALNNAGVTVSNAREENMWVLNIRPMELSVRYAQTRRSWVLGGRQVPRIASCELSAVLVDPDGNVVLTTREGSVVEDTVSPSEILVLESSTENWVNGEMSDEESGNILEPLVVTGVVTALVYLFYSSRN